LQTARHIAAHLAQPDHSHLHLVQCLLDGFTQCCKSGSKICRQMDPQCPPLSVDKNVEVAPRLRGLNRAERKLLPGDLEVVRVIASDLQKHTAVRPPL